MEGSQMNKLKEDFILKGTDYADFKREIKEIDSRTKFKKEFIGNLQIASYCGPNQCIIHQPMCGNAATILGNLQKLNITQLPQNNEFKNDYQNTGFLLLNSNHTYVVSPSAVKTFGKRLGIGGEEFATPGIARDMYISRQMYKHASDICTLIVRTYAGTEKIFAIMSGQYTETKQEILCKTIEQLPEAVCYEWSINNTITKFHLELPSFIDCKLPDTIVPGIILYTSDVGESSLSVQPAWRINGTVVKGEPKALPHTTKVSLTQYLELVKTTINELNSLPQKLVQLNEVNVDSRKIQKVTNKLVTSAGKKNALKLAEKLANVTTAYDACMGIYRYQIAMKDSVAEKYSKMLYSLPQIFMEG